VAAFGVVERRLGGDVSGRLQQCCCDGVFVDIESGDGRRDARESANDLRTSTAMRATRSIRRGIGGVMAGTLALLGAVPGIARAARVSAPGRPNPESPSQPPLLGTRNVQKR
jgi:hypothetical protein